MVTELADIMTEKLTPTGLSSKTSISTVFPSIKVTDDFEKAMCDSVIGKSTLVTV